MPRSAAGKVACVGRATVLFGHRSRGIQPSRALLAALAAVLAAALLALTTARAGDAAEQKPDLRVAVIGANQLFVGETDFYRIVVTNKGPRPVTVPSGTVLLTSTLTGATNSSAGYNGEYSTSSSDGNRTVSFTATDDDTIGVGKTRNFSVQPSSLPAPGTITDAVRVDPNRAIAEANESNNSSTATTTVVEDTDPTASLAFATTDRPDPVRVGDRLTYTLNLTNSGPDPLPPGAYIDDLLPDNVRFVSAKVIEGGKCLFMTDFMDEDQWIECRVSEAVGVGGTVRTKVEVVPRQKGALVNEASARRGGSPSEYLPDTETTRVLRRR
jgi:uncharacterized repeat protein (TIGR01451 family)